MKFQADAHVSNDLVAAIRTLGHDCSDAAAIPQRMPDVDVLLRAASEDRVLITADKDFGELVFVHSIPVPGVILLRLTQSDERSRVDALLRAWPAILTRLPGHFITVGAQGIRARPIG